MERDPASPELVRPDIDLSLFPATTSVSDSGRVGVGGVDLLDLAAEHGTPAFVYDEVGLRTSFRAARSLFGEGVAYATKAFLTPSLARIAADEGMSFDVSSAGEYRCCRLAGVAPDRLVVHGNNKTVQEIDTAVADGVQWIVVDNFVELSRVIDAARRLAVTPRVLIRVNPGIQIHTHRYIATGNRNSKFGFPVWTGDAAEAMETARRAGCLDVVGLHFHIGSFVLSLDTFVAALDAVASIVEQFDPRVLVVGGGLGLRYLRTDECPTLEEWGRAILDWAARRFPGRRVLAEPGRVLVARSALTLYTVGMVQRKGRTRFVAVDGGMSDNPRPMLYGSGYEAFSLTRPLEPHAAVCRLVGRHCETGDTLVERALLPESTAVGDIVCTPVTGAYGYSMASTYNLIPRPPIIMVRDGRARVTTRRETEDDLFAREVAP